ncbi:MAG TPA: pyruvate formate lyase family protein [Phycisphaerae bacterium]|nr:pyruvate formate lyase family protein [Phycisphaerae bacterium]
MSDVHVAPLTYQDRLRHLVERKLKQTREKIARFGSMDEDDLGLVAPPEDFQWEPIANHPNGSFYGARGWAENFASLMQAHPTYVDPMDALAGRWMVFMSRRRPVHWPPEFAYPHLVGDQQTYGITCGIGGDSHFGPDYTIGLERGWGGLLEKVRHGRRNHGPDKAEFYQAEEDVILAVQTWIRRTIEHIHKALLEESAPELKANLTEMAEVNEWIVEHPPRTLREACQWIAWFNMGSRVYNRDGAGGRLDELLRPYYERDIASGRIDDEDALFLIACLLLNETHYYQVGGPGPDGKDLTSKVSFLILEAAHRLGIANNLTVRVHDNMDEELFLTAVGHLLRDRKGWPRFAGDKGLVEGFMRNGYPAELARQRIAVGCHWMAIPGREYTLNDIVKINVAKVFEVAFYDMIEDPTVEPGVAELWRRFEEHLQRAVLCTAKGIDFHLAHQKDNEPELMLNLLCHGPIEKGVDITDGGVEFYNMCVDGSGLATVADSFAALEQRIQRERVLTWAEVAAHLRNNYVDREGLRVRAMLRGSARYGQGGSLGDEWAVRVSKLFAELVKEKRTPGGRIMIPGWFSWSATIKLGKEVGATPDGRGRGEPISHGANPNNGFRADGAATAMAKAIASVQTGYGNTCPMQLEFSGGLEDEEGIAKMAALIKTHFDLGGTLFNVNVIDRDKLLAAHKDPWAYPDLIVRVTGFTAYFAALSPEFRQLVVDRIVGE